MRSATARYLSPCVCLFCVRALEGEHEGKCPRDPDDCRPGFLAGSRSRPGGSACQQANERLQCLSLASLTDCRCRAAIKRRDLKFNSAASCQCVWRPSAATSPQQCDQHAPVVRLRERSQKNRDPCWRIPQSSEHLFPSVSVRLHNAAAAATEPVALCRDLDDFSKARALEE